MTMASCLGCESTDLSRVVLHLAEVKEKAAAHDEHMAKLEQEHKEGNVDAAAVQRAYHIADRLDVEIGYLEDKIAAMRRIAARRRV